jgi:hypothetical protein
VNFQVTVLKVLVSYPDGFASLSDLKRDVAILATSGRGWSERTTKPAARMPELEIFGQGLVERRDGGWQITEEGRSVLARMEAQSEAGPRAQVVAPDSPALTAQPGLLAVTGADRRRPQQRRRRRRASNEARHTSKAS